MSPEWENGALCILEGWMEYRSVLVTWNVTGWSAPTSSPTPNVTKSDKK